VNLAYSQRNRSAICRIPVTQESARQAGGVRAPDGACNPYLCFAALLMAGLDGIQNRIDPGEPVDKDLYELPPEEARLIKQVPGSLGEVLDALEADHEFLLKGDVFTPDLLEAYIAYKRQIELDRCACARIPTSSRCTTISRQQPTTVAITRGRGYFPASLFWVNGFLRICLKRGLDFPNFRCDALINAHLPANYVSEVRSKAPVGSHLVSPNSWDTPVALAC